ncbi:U1 small nuclear ribonucleoprotein C [Coemansia erecta]|nr:U1 small nuclear ribonucleoprotein C [Coemansia erecta]KAJ2888935.1 U1 small nuclear ribonucleoprotein C [Coemansia asiatica]
MPKYYCDYCDIFLTHDSVSVRKAHNSGWKHINQVAAYYRNLPAEKIQSVIVDLKTAYKDYPNPPDLLNDISSIHRNSRNYQSYGNNNNNNSSRDNSRGGGGMRRGGSGRRFGGGTQRSSSPYNRNHSRGPPNDSNGQYGASEYSGDRYSGGGSGSGSGGGSRPRYPPSGAPQIQHGPGPAFSGAPPASRDRERERDRDRGREYRDGDRSGRASNWDR